MWSDKAGRVDMRLLVHPEQSFELGVSISRNSTCNTRVIPQRLCGFKRRQTQRRFGGGCVLSKRGVSQRSSRVARGPGLSQTPSATPSLPDDWPLDPVLGSSRHA